MTAITLNLSLNFVYLFEKCYGVGNTVSYQNEAHAHPTHEKVPFGTFLLAVFSNEAHAHPTHEKVPFGTFLLAVFNLEIMRKLR